MHDLPCRHVVCGRLAVGNGVRAARVTVARRRWPLSLGRAAAPGLAATARAPRTLVVPFRGAPLSAANGRVMYLVTIRTRFDEHAGN